MQGSLKTRGVQQLKAATRHTVRPAVPARRQGRVAATAMEVLERPAQTSNQLPIDFSKLKGALFDIDGTLGNSDPLHFRVFQESLMEIGFNNGEPITDEWFMENISGRHNPQINAELFPDQTEEWRTNWCDNREARFRVLASTELEPIKGLERFTAWVVAKGLRRVAVTNAPRVNAEVMVNGLGLGSFFETLVIGDECTAPKPSPDPYKQGLLKIGMRHAPEQVLVLEDSPSGIRSAVAAKLPVVALLTGQPREALEAAGAGSEAPFIICQDFDELVDLIEAQEKQQQEEREKAEAALASA